MRAPSTRRIVWGFTMVLTITTVGWADDSPVPLPQKVAATDEIAVVFRVSKGLLEDLTREQVEMTTPVRRRVDQFLITGTASGKGVTHIQLHTSDNRAEFLISVTGTAVGRLRSDIGPAIVRGTTRAQFNSRKRVQYDGVIFHDHSAVTNTNNRTTIDRICAKRRGPIGKIVECVGKRMANKSLREVNSVAEDVTADMLSETFDETVVELIDELNQTTEFDELLKKHFPETESWKILLATRPQFILAGAGPRSARLPEFLMNPENPPEAHMEFWCKLTPGQAAILQLIGDLDIAYDLLREMMPEDEARKLAGDVQLDRVGDWSVIRAGLPKEEVRESREE